MRIKISNFQFSEYLVDEESVAAYLSAIMEEENPKLLLSAISDIAKARGMSKIASDAGLGRESLYKALNPGSKPRFETILKVLNSLGVKIQFNAIHEAEDKKRDKKHSPTLEKNTTSRKKLSSPSSSRLKPVIEKKK